MEIRCEQCGHLGPAKEVRPLDGGVGLVCGQCDHVNALAMGAGAVKPSPPETVAEPVRENPVPDIDITAKLAARLIAQAGARPARVRPEGHKDMVDWVKEHALLRLIPPQGDGLRCRKCANIYSADQTHCTRCGLSINEANRHPPGQAPWEKAPKGREAMVERANLLWASATEDWSKEGVDKFVAFVSESELIDLGIRRLQFRLVDYPEDPIALDALAVLARGLETRIIIARSQAQASAEQYQDEITGLRKKLLYVGAVAWLLILLLFSVLVWDKC
jgi:hypothetical protein